MRRLLIALPVVLLVVAVAAGAGYYALNSSAPERTVVAAEIALEPEVSGEVANSPLQADPEIETDPPEPEPERKTEAPIESPKPATEDDKVKATLAELEEKLKKAGLDDLDPVRLEEVKELLGEKLLDAAKHQITLKGKVIDHTGAVVPGANIVLAVPTLGRRNNATSLRAICNSDEQGNFEGTYISSNLEGAAFDIEIYARSADAPDSERQKLTVTPGETYDGISLTLPQGAEISGRVVDGSFNPIFNARVQASAVRRSENQAGGRPSSATTDSDGRFTLKGLAAGSYTVSVTVVGYKAAEAWPSIEAAIGDTAALAADIVMTTESALTFRLNCGDESPGGSFSVEFIFPDGKTARGAGWADKEGNAMVTVLLPGATEIRVTKRGYLQTKAIAIAPVEGQHVDLGEITLEKDPAAKQYPNRGESDGGAIEEKVKKLKELERQLPGKD